MTTNQKPTIGRIVHYRAATSITAAEETAGDYSMAAIVTMTPEEWTPGYRAPDGEWVVTASPQPKPGTVHLHFFPPPGMPGAARYDELDEMDVSEGTGPATWSWPPRV